MLSMKSFAAALVLVASAADVAAPVLVAPALALGVSTVVHAGPTVQAVHPPGASRSILAANGRTGVKAG
jgi:hypothetical protein